MDRFHRKRALRGRYAVDDRVAGVGHLDPVRRLRRLSHERRRAARHARGGVEADTMEPAILTS
jgi:hypothetical protein